MKSLSWKVEDRECGDSADSGDYGMLAGGLILVLVGLAAFIRLGLSLGAVIPQRL
jgi:hypothetical protein